jgi:hypothetical protein
MDENLENVQITSALLLFYRRCNAHRQLRFRVSDMITENIFLFCIYRNTQKSVVNFLTTKRQKIIETNSASSDLFLLPGEYPLKGRDWVTR